MKISNKLTLRLLGLLFVFLLTDCKKKEEEEKTPVAVFSADKTQYKGGEVIKLINTSENAESFRWTMPDGQTSTSTDITYATKELPADQLLTFKLEAFSKSRNKTDYSVKIITVKPSEGQITLYFQYNTAIIPEADIFIDGAKVGSSAMFATSIAPSCGEEGYPTFTLKTGVHVITVSSSWIGTFNKTVTITANSCQVIKMD